MHNKQKQKYPSSSTNLKVIFYSHITRWGDKDSARDNSGTFLNLFIRAIRKK
jgi:hypothetical protein